MKRVKTNRGAALVTAVVVSFLLAMLIVASIGVTSTSFTLSSAHKNSDLAQMLAEAGLNDELALIGRSSFEALPQNRSSQPVTDSGEPYMGRKGAMPGSVGNFWVYSTDPANTSIGWTGQGSVRIFCTAVVQGMARTASIRARPTGMFGAYPLFAVDSVYDGAPAVNLTTGNADLTIVGAAATNGKVALNSGTLIYTKGINFNTVAGLVQFAVTPIRTRAERLPSPWIEQLIKRTFPATAAMTDDDAWAWLKANNDNSARMLQWKTLQANGTPLSPASVVSAPGAAKGILVANSGGAGQGTWSTLNDGPLSAGFRRKALILPPGDYYWEQINSVYDNLTELIIDNAGLSVGGNPNGVPVRIWMNWTQHLETLSVLPQDSRLALLTTFTAPNDPSTFRLFFGVDGQTFEILNNLPAGAFALPGVIYAVTGKYSAGGVPTGSRLGANVRLEGQNSYARRVRILGSLIADRIEVIKDAEVVFSASTPNALDPTGGAVFSGLFSNQ